MGLNDSHKFNIYAPANSTTITTLLDANTLLTGSSAMWDNDIANNCYYNTEYNIYIYPVANVAEARAANGD